MVRPEEKGLHQTRDYNLAGCHAAPPRHLLEEEVIMVPVRVPAPVPATEKILELNDLNFESAVLEAPGPVLVDFTAAWCPPCRALSPILGRFANEAPEGVVVGSVDADAHPDLAARYDIRGLPTLVVFAHGREIARRVGLTTADGLRKLLAAAANAPPAHELAHTPQ
jgi:thioredoxin 1